MRTNRDHILQLTEAATAVAVSVVLGNLRLLELPNGGSITLASIPLLAFALVRGFRASIVVCTCAGLAHAAMGGTVVHPVQLLLDYGVGYAVLALAGLGRSLTGWSVGVRVGVAALLQLAAASLSGVVFFGSSMQTAAAWRYSVVYNAATLVPEAMLAMLLVPAAARAICRADPARAWRAGHSAPPPARRAAPRFPRHRAAPEPAQARPRTVIRPPARPAGAFVRPAPFHASRPGAGAASALERERAN